MIRNLCSYVLLGDGGSLALGIDAIVLVSPCCDGLCRCCGRYADMRHFDGVELCLHVALLGVVALWGSSPCEGRRLVGVVAL